MSACYNFYVKQQVSRTGGEVTDETVGKIKLLRKKTVRDVPLEGKTVLVRTDYNVPLAADGGIDDDFRIRRSLDTLRYLIKNGCRVVICSHLGRPDGKVVPAYSLAPVAERLAQLLEVPVSFARESVGDQVSQSAKRLSGGQLLMLENLRFHAGEEANDASFARLLASSCDAAYFIQDGFGVSHRRHASTDAITRFLPSVAGLLLESEYDTITGALSHPKQPLVAVLGGAKISDKIKVIERFVKLADQIIIGGAMANTFLKFKGLPIGQSVHEDGLDDVIKRVYQRADDKLRGRRPADDFILLPSDAAVATAINGEQRRQTVSVRDVRPDEYILDIGPATIAEAINRIKDSQTVVWSGTLGYAELPQFSYGSARLALQLASQKRTLSIIGGGDTADFAVNWDAKGGDSFTHVSTGGSASLELMAGMRLPGIDCLLDA